MGVQTIESPVTLEDTTRTRYELELASQLFANERIDFALSVGGSSLGKHEDAESGFYDDGTFWELYSTDQLSLIDVRLAARLHPLGQEGPLRPYLGAGLGYFWFIDSWEDEYYETIYDPEPITFFDEEEDTETLADGLFPFVMAGLNIAVNDNAEILLEFQYDIEKKDSGFDFGGPIFMAGARFRF
jgi:outer membrane protein W